MHNLCQSYIILNEIKDINMLFIKRLTQVVDYKYSKILCIKFGYVLHFGASEYS